jgi:hypothetical protein
MAGCEASEVEAERASVGEVGLGFVIHVDDALIADGAEAALPHPFRAVVGGSAGSAPRMIFVRMVESSGTATVTPSKPARPVPMPNPADPLLFTGRYNRRSPALWAIRS